MANMTYYSQYRMAPQERNVRAVDAGNLLDVINKASFAMDDTRLFLDTHPECEEAKDYFRKMEKIRNEAIREYERHFGPILAYHSGRENCEEWDWTKGPLPWESQCCNGRRV